MQLPQLRMALSGNCMQLSQVRLHGAFGATTTATATVSQRKAFTVASAFG